MTALEIVAVVVLSLLVDVLSDPPTRLTACCMRRFPELARFKSCEDAEAALDRAREAVRWPHALARLFVGLPTIALIVWCWTRVHLLVPSWGLHRPLAACVIIAGAFAVAGAAIGIALARKISMSLRQQLSDSGIAICRSCGYDVTGNTSGKCPECGGAL